jgi:hypothetical protein
MIHKEIRKVLNVNYTHYSNYRHSRFEKWCHIYACKKGICKRRLINHEGLYNWYCDQWNTIVENLFYQDNQHYIESSVEHPQAYWDLFHSYPNAIDGFFPGILLTMIQKQHNTVRHELN